MVRYTDFYVSRRESCRGKLGKKTSTLNKRTYTLYVRRNQYVFLKNVKNVTRSMRKVPCCIETHALGLGEP